MNQVRQYLKVGQRKNAEKQFSQKEEQDELYFQNFEEEKQNEDAVFFGFKRMRISDDKDELTEIFNHLKKIKQVGDDSICLSNSHYPIFQETQTSISPENSIPQQNIEMLELGFDSQKETSEQFKIIQIDEINYVNSLDLMKQKVNRNIERYNSRKVKKVSPKYIVIKNKTISK